MSIVKTVVIFFLVLLIGSIRANGQSDRWQDSLARVIETSRAAGIPVEPLENKIREGRAKGRSAREILPVVVRRREMLSQIMEENNGTVPGGYMHDLFERERTVSVQVVHDPGAEGDIPSVNSDFRKPVSGAKKRNITSNSEKDASGEIENHRRKTDRLKEMQERKIEKLLEKNERKVNKRMESAEKRMQKRMEKRYGRE